MGMEHPTAYPSPVFEGSEKRIIITFRGADAASTTLRAIPRQDLDEMLAIAECEVVHQSSNDFQDAYVLSESSMFVSDDRVVLKTCGRTKLLAAIPYLLELAENSCSMVPTRVKYSRASFLFPDQQPEVYHKFEDECTLLKETFGSLGVRAAHVLGDSMNGHLQWHVFVAGEKNMAEVNATVVNTTVNGVPKAVNNTNSFNNINNINTLEIAMTGLAIDAASQFFKENSVSPQMTTMSTGISSIVPQHLIDDYVFEPCGYSMNGTDNAEFSTIHVTPEDGFSYASFEVCGANVSAGAVTDYVAKTLRTFRPESVTVAFSVENQGSQGPSGVACPAGYKFVGTSYAEDGVGGEMALFVFERLSAEEAAEMEAERVKKGSFDVADPDSVLSHRLLKSIPSASTIGGASFAMSMSNTVSLTTATPPSSLGEPSEASEGSDQDYQVERRPIVRPPSKKTFGDVMTSVGASKVASSKAVEVDAFAAKLIANHHLEDNFYVMDLSSVKRLYSAWEAAMPRVHPHYAVKCNNDRALLEVLAVLGAGFDCASEAEVELVMSLGVSADRIIFANPCKRPADIRALASRGIVHSTFDTESELVKLNRWAPGSRVLLRIRADDESARCQLGNKFGAEEWEWEKLFEAARALGVPVDGVSFHVGSGATDPNAFTYAIELAKKAFDMGKTYGFDMNILDVGGGFCGGKVDVGGNVDFQGVDVALNAALEEHFAEGSIDGLTIIAEPGRFFTETIATLGTLVYGRRSRGEDMMDYWVTDGLYGSMNCLLYDHATVAPRPLLMASKNGADTSGPDALSVPRRPSTVFGPTCDGLDTVLRDYELPEMDVGDWLMFPNMGAYTLCGASKFNGINAVDVPTFYVYSG